MSDLNVARAARKRSPTPHDPVTRRLGMFPDGGSDGRGIDRQPDWSLGISQRASDSVAKVCEVVATCSLRRSGIEEPKCGQHTPNPLEVRVAGPKPGGCIHCRNGDLDVGQRNGLAALSKTCRRFSDALPLERPQPRPRQSRQQ